MLVLLLLVAARGVSRNQRLPFCMPSMRTHLYDWQQRSVESGQGRHSNHRYTRSREVGATQRGGRTEEIKDPGDDSFATARSMHQQHEAETEASRQLLTERLYGVRTVACPIARSRQPEVPRSCFATVTAQHHELGSHQCETHLYATVQLNQGL